MIQIDISHRLSGKARRSRPLIESCLKTIERRCAFATEAPAHCRVRVLRDHLGHSTSHEPRQYVVCIELSIPGWGPPFIAKNTAHRLRPAVAGAAARIEKELRKKSGKRESALKSRRPTQWSLPIEGSGDTDIHFER